MSSSTASSIGAARYAEPLQRTPPEPRPHAIDRRRDVPPQPSRIVVTGIERDPGQRRVLARAPRRAPRSSSRTRPVPRRASATASHPPPAPSRDADGRPCLHAHPEPRAWPRSAGEEGPYPIRAWSSPPWPRPSVAAPAPRGYPRGSERRRGLASASVRQAPKPRSTCVGRGRVQRDVDVDCSDLRSGGHARVAREEIGGEVAAGDLRRRPPQRLPDASTAVSRGPLRERTKCGAAPVSSIPRSTGRNGAGSIGAPCRAATCCATASACWSAMPPCLTGKSVASPAAYTPSGPRTPPCSIDRDEVVGRRPRHARRAPGRARAAAPRSGRREARGRCGAARPRPRGRRRRSRRRTRSPRRPAVRATIALGSAPKTATGSSSGVIR